MGDFLATILLNNLAILGILFVAVVIITAWAVSLKEYAGYALGWLVGILLIIFFSVLVPPSSGSSQPSQGISLGFIELFLVTVFGVVAGFLAQFLIRYTVYGNNILIRAVVVAAVLAFTLFYGYLVLSVNVNDRWGFAIFALTFGIGVALNIIVMRSR